jgi:hypothetical protein
MSSIIDDGNNGYYIFGPAFDPSYLHIYVFAMRVDSSGSILWSKRYNQLCNGAVYVNKTPDNGFVICSTNDSTPDLKTGVLKIDSSGTPEWNKIYSAQNMMLSPSGILCSPDSGFVVAGTRTTMSQAVQGAFLFKTDLNGNIIWSNEYGSVFEYGRSAIFKDDGGIVIAGSTNGLPTMTYTTGYIVKTDSMGVSGCFEQPILIDTTSQQITETNLIYTTSPFYFFNSTLTLPTETNDAAHFFCSTVNTVNIQTVNTTIFYPDPVHQNAALKLNSMSGEQYRLVIYDVFGKQISERKISERETELNLSEMKNGIYFYEVRNSTEKMNGTFSVIH